MNSRDRLFPDLPLNTRCSPLSILDATVLRFAPTACIWIYKNTIPINQLTSSLKETIKGCPQWAGRLHWAPYDVQASHTNRHGRLMLTYGTADDPGIEYIISYSSQDVLSLTLVDEMVNGICSANKPTEELLDSTIPLALHESIESEGLPGPCMIIQVTNFIKGGTAVAVKLAHPLADAHTLLQFMHDWAASCRASIAGTPPPVMTPVFDPLLLDRAAAGNIEAPQPDPALLTISRALPLHRYDWWASANGCPAPFRSSTVIPRTIHPKVVGSMGTPLPWAEWDITAPVDHCLITFAPDELREMWKDAFSVSRVSHLDALLAHVWRLIIHAQGLGNNETHHLDVTLSARTRIDPPLPKGYLGSPLTLMKVDLKGHQASDDALGKIALSIRSSLGLFNPTTFPAYLHDLAFESNPQRHWNAFLGRRNIIFTSWLQLGVREVDFGTGFPDHVEAVMPNMDGCMQIMEAVVKRNGIDQWYDNEVNVSLHLRSDVMQKLLEDRMLRKYRLAE